MSTKNSKTEAVYTLSEEIANGITHGIGAMLSVAGLTVLVVLAAIYGDAWRIVSFSIYGASLVLLYTASTLYHAIQHPDAKRIFRIMDHAAIYLLIAGTYTPITLVNMRGPWGWSIFGFVWALAIIGIIFKTMYTGRYDKISTAAYVLMGWICLIGLKEMLVAIPPGGLVWLVAGGVCYTVGVIFYAWQKLPFNHAIWHLFVLGGSMCHFFAILFHVLPGA
ncbi:MAG: hemolysin III family protein [Ardenticatenaceae bacterium]|nr:hemolysin III family protein [Ardenticatenaceae bacterium]